MPIRKFLPAALLALSVPAMAQEEHKTAPASRTPVPAEAENAPLRAGDTVDIRVSRHDELAVRGPVGTDGTVALMHIGSVALAGLTPVQAGARIEALYADGWLKKPQVSVNVTEYARGRFTVTGEVNRPNTYTLPRNRGMTLLEAIGTAGHFKTTANQRTVILKRGGRSYEINVKGILKNPATDVPLKDGDLIWVKESLF